MRQKRHSNIARWDLQTALTYCWDIFSIMHIENAQTFVDCDKSKTMFLSKLRNDDIASRTSLRLLSCEFNVKKKHLIVSFFHENWKMQIANKHSLNFDRNCDKNQSHQKRKDTIKKTFTVIRSIKVIRKIISIINIQFQFDFRKNKICKKLQSFLFI